MSSRATCEPNARRASHGAFRLVGLRGHRETRQLNATYWFGLRGLGRGMLSVCQLCLSNRVGRLGLLERSAPFRLWP